MLVHELMSAPAVVAPLSLSLPDAAHLMKSRGIRRLPVEDGSRLVGTVTDRDLREALPSKVSSLSPWEVTTRLAAVNVQDVMRRSVLTTTSDAAAHTLLHHRIGALPVIDAAGTMIGLLSVSDVLRDYARPSDGQNGPEARP